MKWHHFLKSKTTLIVEVFRDGSKGAFVYAVDVPNYLSDDMYELIAQGILFENDWTQDGTKWTWRKNGHS